MHIKISENSDPNYLITIVNLPKPTDHPNADKLSLVEIFGNTIIIAKDSFTEGEKVAYFPVESCISPSFLSWSNLYYDSKLNRDPNKKGFFMENGRVRAISLRKIRSQGFLCKLKNLAEFANVDEQNLKIYDNFDVLNGETLIYKFQKKTNKTPISSDERVSIYEKFVHPFIKKYINRTKSENFANRILPRQFNFHYTTEQLGRNIDKLCHYDDIVITAKLHGVSAIFSKLLVSKPRNPIDILLKKFGFNIPLNEYSFVYSSRNIIKNNNKGYTDDVWGEWAKKLEHLIPDGISIYGEIVGYNSNGKCIQKKYDYGLNNRQSEFYVYRVTKTDGNGNVHEYSWNQLFDLCVDLDLCPVPLYYDGIAENLFDIPVDENWRENFLSCLKTKYLDRTCEFCERDVVNEGIVIRIESQENIPTFKYKSPMFVEGESISRDKGEVNLEEES